MLPDNVLLEIFNFYRMKYQVRDEWHFKWRPLVHVCRRWREIVFASPHRLDLRIVCKHGTPVRENLGIWPALPIVFEYQNYMTPNDEDNILAALQHSDRVSHLKLHAVTGSLLGKMATVMQRPFPVLTRLHIRSDGLARVLPGGFLGGSALSLLQTILLSGVPFPTLPTLLISTSDLITLELKYIPPTGYISPEVMVMSLAALPRLESFTVEFQSVTSRPNQIPPPPATRTVLPALARFQFQGASEYLEAFVAQIDCPQMDRINIYYFNQLADFQVAHLSQFIDRSAGPEMTLIRHAEVIFSNDSVSFTLSPHENYPYSHLRQVDIICEGIDWQVSHMAQVLSQIPVALSRVVHLWLEMTTASEKVGADDVEWLHLLHQFPTVRTLHVNWDLARHVAPVLEGQVEGTTGGMAAEVLPSIKLIWIGDQKLKKFKAARRLSGRPVTVCSKSKFNARIQSYVEKSFP